MFYGSAPLSLPFDQGQDNICSDNGEMDLLFHILESAEQVVSCPDQFLEPTPLGPNGVQILAETVPVTENTWHVDQALIDALNPLILREKKDEFPAPCFSIPTPSLKQRRRLNFSLTKDEEIQKASMEEVSSITHRETARFRQYQADQWKERFQVLIDFHQEHGHCLVPHEYPENPHLAKWTKRQRYQHKLKQMNRHSTLTDARQKLLEEMGFVWDSHKAAWIERFESLKMFHAEEGHCNVPSNYSDRPLAVWVKSQRRQYRLFRLGGRSTFNEERHAQLEALGFDWNPRNLKK